MAHDLDILRWSARRTCRAIWGGEISVTEHMPELLAHRCRNADLSAFLTLDEETAVACALEASPPDAVRPDRLTNHTNEGA